MSIDIGDTIRIEAILLVGDIPTDPATLRLEITDPASTVTIYRLSIDPEIVQDSEGTFHFDLFITQAGAWQYAWFSNSTMPAFKTGEIVTSQTFTIQAIDDSIAPAPVGFTDVIVKDRDLNHITVLRLDAAGEGSVSLDEGFYVFEASKYGWRFPSITADLSTPSAGPASDVVLQGCQTEDSWLTVRDLETVISTESIDRLFQDDGGNSRNYILIASIIEEAEAIAESKLLRSWSKEQIVRLAWHDRALRMQAAWIAVELATERRGEFIAADGKGRFWTQYERAIEYFDALSKSKIQSRGEKAPTRLGVAAGGVSANTGGKRTPTPTANNWVFSDEADGRQHGGF